MKTYYIEVLEDDRPKIVPHDEKKNYEFINKKKAGEFLKQLVENNPSAKFRLVTKTETYKETEWQKKQ